MLNRSGQPPFHIYPFNKPEISQLMELFDPEPGMLYTPTTTTSFSGTDVQSLAISTEDLSVWQLTN
jgi:hypothetical protein